MKVDILLAGAGAVLAAEIAANEYLIRRREKKSAPSPSGKEGHTVFVAPKLLNRRLVRTTQGR